MSEKRREIRIENKTELEEFMVSQGLKDYSKVPVEKVAFTRRVKVAFWFLRIYIIVMVVLVIVGFAHIV
jgi:hypothetical protein